MRKAIVFKQKRKMYQNFPKHTGIYHIRDNIDCLELEVHFRHVNSLLKLPKFEHSSTRSKKAVKKQDDPDQSNNVSTTRICWQQKIFSPAEIELYREARNCLTDTQKKYHQWFLENDDQLTSTGISPKRTQKRKAARSRKQKFTPKLKFGEVFTYVESDNFQPDALTINTNNVPHAHSGAVKAPVCMYVYAAISPDTQLLSLIWHPEQQQLHIYPDFNNFDENPYYIEIDTDYRHLYAYGVHNVSLRRPVVLTATSFLKLPGLPTTISWQQEPELSAKFSVPPKHTTRISLLFELRTASDFGGNSLHVRYHTQLPPNALLEEGELHACTHSSKPTSPANVFYFGYTWQLTLLCEEEFNTADLLHLYFELISIDNWERERVEGYAHYGTHLLPGYNTLQLQCLRPSMGFMETINRYFIGGRKKFDFTRYFTQPQNTNEAATFHSRYGCQMQSTGQLQLSCQILTQRNCALLQQCGSRPVGMTLDDIMLAYREARHRLEAVVLK